MLLTQVGATDRRRHGAHMFFPDIKYAGVPFILQRKIFCILIFDLAESVGSPEEDGGGRPHPVISIFLMRELRSSLKPH